MKLAQFYKGNKIKTGYFDGEKIIELLDPMEKVLNYWNDWQYMNKQLKISYSLEDIVLAPPIIPSKIICVGLNYKDHAKELGMKIPFEPKLFLKPPSSITGHNDLIKYPQTSHQIDFEGELAIIISKQGKNIEMNESCEYIGGYTILNDVTARDLQKKDEQWTRSKSFDTFCPIGPYIETEMDPNNQNISLTINGEIKQKSNTKNMIFSPEELIEFISHIMTLNPGDIIATGTPPGVGSMERGDTVEITIDNIGTLKNKII